MEWEKENCGDHCYMFGSTRSASALDLMQKEQPCLRVWTDPGLSLKAPHLCSCVLPCWLQHRGTYFKSKPSMKTVQHVLSPSKDQTSVIFWAFSLELTLWHTRPMDPARTGTGARLMSMYCGWHWAGNLLQPMPRQGSLSIMSDRPVQLHHLPYKYFTSSFDHCFPSARWPQLVMLTWTVWWDILATTTSSPCLPPRDLNSSLPCTSPQVQPHDICAICRKCLSRPGGWK